MPESPSGVSSGQAGAGSLPHSSALAPDEGSPEGPEPTKAPDVPPAGIDLPATFGKYFLTEKLATGGMAEIYLAKIVGPGGFEKQLVIKQIHPRFGSRPASGACSTSLPRSTP